MPRPTPHRRVPVVAATALSLLGAAPAAAHQADPSYDSVLRTVAPRTPGLRVAVLARGDELSIVNETGSVVEVPGYRGEPYLRLLPDGTVQENLRSQATFTNRDPKGTTPAPPSADASGPRSRARWRTVDRSSRVAFHDHRIHWMGPEGEPAPQVRDPDRRSRVYDWTVPIRVDGRPGRITGTLFWIPEEDGVPVAAIGALAAVLAASAALVLVVRRRRGGPGSPAEDVW